MTRAIRGVLVECDPSIKSIILSFDAANHDFVIEDLDEGRLVVKENMVQVLRQRLDEFLKSTRNPPQDSGSEGE